MADQEGNFNAARHGGRLTRLTLGNLPAKMRRHTAAARKRGMAKRRKLGIPADRQERVCPVCEVTFTSNRYSQIYCGKQCKAHVLNGRRIDKTRKADKDPFSISPELIYRRAAAVRQGWTDGERTAHDKLIPEMPLFKEPPTISQAARVKSHLQTGNDYGALKIAAGWKMRIPNEVGFAIGEAWQAYQSNRTGNGQAGVVIGRGLAALREHLKVK